MRWTPKLGQELAGVKIESRRLMMPGYSARSLVSDGITSPSSMESFSVCDCGACGYVCNALALCTYPCVDGPWGSSRALQNLVAVRMRSCVRPQIVAAQWPQGPDGFRERHQTQARHFTAKDMYGFLSLVGSTDYHLLLAFNPSTPARGLGGSDRLTPICFPVRHHGPNGPGHLVS
jgi:hypothetical protein